MGLHYFDGWIVTSRACIPDVSTLEIADFLFPTESARFDEPLRGHVRKAYGWCVDSADHLDNTIGVVFVKLGVQVAPSVAKENSAGAWKTGPDGLHYVASHPVLLKAQEEQDRIARIPNWRPNVSIGVAAQRWSVTATNPGFTQVASEHSDGDEDFVNEFKRVNVDTAKPKNVTQNPLSHGWMNTLSQEMDYYLAHESIKLTMEQISTQHSGGGSLCTSRPWLPRLLQFRRDELPLLVQGVPVFVATGSTFSFVGIVVALNDVTLWVLPQHIINEEIFPLVLELFENISIIEERAPEQLAAQTLGIATVQSMVQETPMYVIAKRNSLDLYELEPDCSFVTVPTSPFVAWYRRRSYAEVAIAVEEGRSMKGTPVEAKSVKLSVQSFNSGGSSSNKDSSDVFEVEQAIDIFGNENGFIVYPANPSCLFHATGEESKIENPRISKIHKDEKIAVTFLLPNALPAPSDRKPTPSPTILRPDGAIHPKYDVTARFDLGVYYVTCHLPENFNYSQDDITLAHIRQVIMYPLSFVSKEGCSITTPPAQIDWKLLLGSQDMEPGCRYLDAAVVLMAKGALTRKSKNRQEKLLPESIAWMDTKDLVAGVIHRLNQRSYRKNVLLATKLKLLNSLRHPKQIKSTDRPTRPAPFYMPNPDVTIPDSALRANTLWKDATTLVNKMYHGGTKQNRCFMRQKEGKIYAKVVMGGSKVKD